MGTFTGNESRGTPEPSPNFSYLAYHDARLVALGTQAEEHFGADPSVTLFKLRQFGEVLAQRAAAKVGIFTDRQERQIDLIDRLHDRGVIGATQRRLFHDLRRVGNAAVHDGAAEHTEALHQLKMARELGLWFQRSFGNNKKFDPGPFVPPSKPRRDGAPPGKLDELESELAALRQLADARADQLAAAQREAEQARQQAEQEALARMSAEEYAAQAEQERQIWETLAAEQAEAPAHPSEQQLANQARLEAQNQQLAAELAAMQAAAEAAPIEQLNHTIERAAAASEAIQLSESDTRRLIDKQLRAAGWEADSEQLRFGNGVRPQKHKNLAIAEWPTQLDGKIGYADYLLFAGLSPIGVVEAKRSRKDVFGAIVQAKRYSRGYQIHGDEQPIGSWGNCRVPFLFATNGRPYLRQLETKSGIAFLDAREPHNHPRALPEWYTPDGLQALLKQDHAAAYQALADEPTDYLKLRDYQLAAIHAVEQGLQAGKRELLVAMATGTGKTRTCIGLCYRLLKTGRFRRVLFLVDRSALGEQTANELKEMRLDNTQTFTDIFEVKELGDIQVNRDTRMHIATIQSLVKRVLFADDEAGQAPPPIDQYDCIIVDECHRGYLLDREMSDRELTFRSEQDYISKYRRVLEHFDAVKVGLTATPALHTKEIFGPPVFNYGYREAVIDGCLIDHEPPIRIVTKLAADGIHYQAGEEIVTVDRDTSKVDRSTLADEVDFEIDTFNKSVITENFNRAVLAEVVRHIDPEQGEKTLVFCATDAHCDMVVRLLKEALKAQYGHCDDDAVVKITGAADHPLQLIRSYRNERLPNIAVTVDLLTTGINVRPISNLVFLRRVRSRILYDQMVGRATRQCPAIGKERFRIFDAVDLYNGLREVTDMKPVVVNPKVTFTQLAAELAAADDDDTRRIVLEEFVAKLQRKKRSIQAERASQFEAAAGCDLPELLQQLKRGTPEDAAQWITGHAEVAALLDRASGGGPVSYVISEHYDEVREVTRGYGNAHKPEDYIERFRAFIQHNQNKIAALNVVLQRPRELTRQQLKELRLLLDREGYRTSALQTAWRETKNEDIAANIIGYIRHLALGSPLLSYQERVDMAMKRILKSQSWSDPQRKWLDRIAKQLKVETVVDREALERGEFKAHGGFTRLNKVFNGQLEQLLGTIGDEIWKDAG